MRSALMIGALLLAMPAAAQDVTERLATCGACHGVTGTSEQPSIPSLGAMPSNYVLTQLYMFREKLRVVDPMNAMAEGLTDDELRALGDAFSKMPAPEPASELAMAEQEAGMALINRHHCNSCHGANLGGQQTIPRIAGQHAEYIEQSLVAYKNNTRRGYSATMNEASQEIADADIPLLARYIATLK